MGSQSSPNAFGSIEFRPRKVNSIVPLIQEQNQRDAAAMARYGQSLNQNAQAAINDIQRERDAANQFSEDLRSIANLQEKVGDFTSTLVKQRNAADKLRAEEQEIDDYYSYVMGGLSNGDVVEKNQEQVAKQQAETTSEVSNAAEKVTGGDEALSQSVRARTSTPLGVGFAGERAVLMEAQSTYGGFLNAWLSSNETFKLNGQTISVREAVTSGNPAMVQAVIAQGRYNFIKQNRLQYASKRSFIKYFSQSMFAAEGGAASTLVRENISDGRKENISRISGLGYNLTKTTSLTQIGSTFRNLSEQFFVENTGLSRGEANEKALKTLIEGYVDQGNVEAIEALADTNKLEGNGGTRLGNQYGALLAQAKDDAIKQREGAIEQVGKDIEATMYQQLAGATTVEQKAQIIETAAQRMENQGDFKGARDLRGQYEELAVEGNNERITAQLQEAIINEEITNPEDLKPYRLSGRITQRQFESLEQDIKTRAQGRPSNDPRVKTLVNGFKKSVKIDFLSTVGLRKTPTGEIVVDPKLGQTPALSPGEAEVVVAQMNYDITRTMNEMISANPELLQNDGALAEALHRANQDWVKTNLQTEGGKYYVGGIKSNGTDATKAWDEQGLKNFRARVLDPENLGNASQLSKPITSSQGSTSPQDYSSTVIPGSAIDSSVKESFRPLRGDKVFTPDELKSYVKEYEESGRFNPQLQRTATELGMTPLALMNQQIGSMPNSGLKPQQFRVNETQSYVTPTNAVDGAHRLMALGFSQQGAAYLAGNIQQESSWVANRPAWNDGQNMAGGLISWNGPRLQRIESYFGKPIQSISAQEQLSFMVQEMKNDFPKAYNTFTTPGKTKRQLENASYDYWRWLDEGNRFQYSEQINRKLGSRVSQQSQRTARVSQGTNEGIIITSAIDASGEPGSDFVISNGQRGAKFHFPYEAQVLRVVRNNNWETHLENGPGKRGYGNLVELRLTLPNGNKTDVLIAHFDDVNSQLRPGMRIPSNSFIGTQGRTGSTTGAHISIDWYVPGTSQGDTASRNWFVQNYLS